MPDCVIGILWDRPEPVEALPEIPEKTVGLAEPLRAQRRLAAAKHFESSFQMLMIPLDSLLLHFSCDVFDLREHGGQSRWVGGGLVGGHRLRSHPRVLESRAQESYSGFGVTMFLEQHLDDLTILIDRTVDITPAPRHFDIRFVDRPARAHAVPMRLGRVLLVSCL